MGSASSLLRSLLIYSICLPLAIFLGYIIAQEGNPLYNISTYFGVLSILFLLALPLLLRWHHGLLIATWNLSAYLYFLPGRPDLWMVMAWLSLSLAILQFILNRRQRFLSVPSVTRPLLFLLIVVLATAALRGGFGVAAFGGQTYGGKRYLLILSAVIGYFALISRPMDPRYATRCVLLFFLGSAVAAIGELGSILPESLYFIYLLFPVTTHGLHSIIDSPVGPTALISRFGGLATAAAGAYYAMLARYGVGEIFRVRRIVQLLLFLGLVLLSLLGGFRGRVLEIMLLFAILFYAEGLMRTRLLPIFALVFVLVGALLVGFVRELPLNVQRTLSVLPLPVDPIARADAEASSEWRINIWKNVIPQIPQYLWLGKGLGFSARELQSLINVDPRSGLAQTSETGVELVSDYHNGPLSVIIPFGTAGVIGFLWFLAASGRVLYRNYRYGNPAYAKLNNFLLAYFIVKVIFFFFVFGNLYSDFAIFTGLVGLSISLNAGVAKPILLLPPPRGRVRLRRIPQGVRKPVPIHAGIGHPV
jgi:hypothetical protein